MTNRVIYQAMCSLVIFIVVGCRASSRTDPPIVEPLSPTAAAVKATDGGEIPLSTPIPGSTATPLPSPPDGWVELSDPSLGIILYRPAGWEAIPFDAHNLDLRAPEGDGWIELNMVDATNAADWGADDLMWQPQSILTALVKAAREDGEFADPFAVSMINGTEAWVTQGTNDVIGDRLWIGVVGLEDRALVALGHGQKTTENWDSELAPIYADLLWSIHRIP